MRLVPTSENCYREYNGLRVFFMHESAAPEKIYLNGNDCLRRVIKPTKFFCWTRFRFVKWKSSVLHNEDWQDNYFFFLISSWADQTEALESLSSDRKERNEAGKTICLATSEKRQCHVCIRSQLEKEWQAFRLTHHFARIDIIQWNKQTDLCK